MVRADVAFLLAPGAGAPASHPRMQDLARLLGDIGRVQTLDYAYAQEGRRRPDPLPRLIETHRAALALLRARHKGPIVLAGKSMGGRVGCHLALSEPVAGLVCFGYPLLGGGNPNKMRDEVLIALATPVLFIQGTRDPLCPLETLASVRDRMKAPTQLHVVEGGDHSLIVSKTVLKNTARTQDDCDRAMGDAISAFVAGLVPAG